MITKVFPYRLIDLTHPLDESMPTWSGGCGFKHELKMDYSDCSGQTKFRVMNLKMDAGVGTHMDAPSHCIMHGKCIDDFDVNDLIFSCIVVDVSEKCHERYSLSINDLIDFERNHGLIPKKACVMVKTGWDKFWNEPVRYRNNHLFPSISWGAAQFLLERGIDALGIDTFSPDRPEDGFKVHQTFLEKGKILIENVANLDKMPYIDGFVMVCPLKIRHGNESPIRLIGLVNP